MLSFIKRNINPSRVKGVMTAPWAKAFKEEDPKAAAGIKLFAAAKRRYYR
jgi:hypothetical protein